MRRKQGLADVGEPNEEERDSKKESREGADGGLKTEQKMPNDRNTEDCANVVRCNTGLPVRTGEQHDLVAGRVQRLRNDQLS